jgi:glutamyl-tRNA reductase
MVITLFGTNHSFLDVAERELLAIPDAEIPDALAELVSDPHIEEACIVNTCNRVEFYIYSDDGACVPRAVRTLYQKRRGIDIRKYTDGFYFRKDDQAVRQLFRVISGLDSMVIGEVDIIHQVKQMYQLCVDAGTSGLILDRIFHQAFSVSKRVRSETSISAGTTSLAMIAVDCVARQRGTLKGSRTAVVGSGPMAMRMARYLQKKGAASLTLVNRTISRVAHHAPRLGAQVRSFDDLATVLSENDVVMFGIRYDGHLITTDDLKRMATTNPGLVIVDIGVPRVVQHAENTADGVQVFDIDDFHGVLEETFERRKLAAGEAEQIIDREIEKFSSWRQHAVVLPDIVQLRRKVGQICESELEKHTANLPEESLEAVRSFARSLSERIIQTPIETLRAQMFTPDSGERLARFRELFNLDADNEVMETGREESVDFTAYREYLS